MIGGLPTLSHADDSAFSLAHDDARLRIAMPDYHDSGAYFLGPMFSSRQLRRV
jgi:hypothetical protein